MPRSLPVLNSEVTSSALRPDGKRTFVVPADVSGRLHRLRHTLFALLIGLWIALPWVEVGGHPAVFLAVEHRAFYLFGSVFNAQDFWLVFFLVSGMGFALIVVTALYGRVWCGYACPQTVFLDGVFRRVERLIEGPRNTRLRRDQAGLSLERVLRKAAKHTVFFVLAFVIAHIVLSYFVSLPNVLRYVRADPAGHPEAFGWAFAMTTLFYLNFAFFREQLCLIICPYGRLQSVLTDSDTVSISYDVRRGEPRGHKKSGAGEQARGDCVDCGRCVVVCPTGIDIRNGLQLDCIGCSACVDACDEVMTRLHRPRGLIRYGSQRQLAGGERRWLRPRIYAYAVLGVVGLLVAAISVRSRQPFETNLLRLSGAPMVLEQDGARVRNAFELHIVNKRSSTTRFSIHGAGPGGLEYVLPVRELELGSLAERRVPVFVSAPNDGSKRTVRLDIADGDVTRSVEAAFIAP
jgi:cytochrome c oxidase accessory protein FixG